MENWEKYMNEDRVATCRDRSRLHDVVAAVAAVENVCDIDTVYNSRWQTFPTTNIVVDEVQSHQ